MSTALSRSRNLSLAAIVLVAALLAAVIFLGWLRYGSAIFLSLMETGLSYCF